MADRERCFCGEMSLTRGGYCHRHRQMDTTLPEAVAPSAEAESLRRQRDDALRRARELEQQLSDAKRALSHTNKLLTLIAIGDVKPSEIDEARRG